MRKINTRLLQNNEFIIQIFPDHLQYRLMKAQG